MNLELIQPMGKMKAGETMYARTQEQADLLVEQGFAKHIPDDEVTEKELVLLNPEPGTYTTAWKTVSKKDSDTSAADSDNGESIAMTAKELIEKVNAATTEEEVNALVSETETRKTVLDAVSKKKDEFSKA